MTGVGAGVRSRCYFPRSMAEFPFTIDRGALRALSARWVEAFAELDRTVRKCSRSLTEKHVHAARLAARHGLPVLEILHAAAPDEECWASAYKALRALLRALGPLRDAQLRFARLQRMAAREGPVRPLLLRASVEVETRSRAAARALRAYPGAPGANVREWFRSNDPGRRKDVVRAVHERHGHRRARLLQRWRAMDPRRPSTLHRARIALKRYRYLLLALEEVLPVECERELEHLARAQKIIGRVHDDQLFIAWLRRQGPAARPLIERVRAKLPRQRERVRELLSKRPPGGDA